jgi:hypothetical protein
LKLGKLIQEIFAKPVHEDSQNSFHFPFLQKKMENGRLGSSLFQPLVEGPEGQTWHQWTPLYKMVEFCLNHDNLAKTGQLLINDAVKTREQIDPRPGAAFSEFFIYAFHFYVEQGQLQEKNGPVWAHAFVDNAKARQNPTKILNQARILVGVVDPLHKYHPGVAQMADTFLSELRKMPEVEEKTRYWLATTAIGLPNSNDFFQSLKPQHLIEMITKQDVSKDKDSHSFHFWRRFKLIQKTRPDLTQALFSANPKIETVYKQEKETLLAPTVV